MRLPRQPLQRRFTRPLRLRHRLPRSRRRPHLLRYRQGRSFRRFSRVFRGWVRLFSAHPRPRPAGEVLTADPAGAVRTVEAAGAMVAVAGATAGSAAGEPWQ